MNNFKQHLLDPNNEYPINIGERWTDEEEKQLLEELKQQIDILKIAEIHKRTEGGIISRQRHIAYVLYSNKMDIIEISDITKLPVKKIIELVNKKNSKKKKNESPARVCEIELHSNNLKKCEINPEFSIENELIEMKKDMKDLKNTMNELIIMIKSIYEFEDSE